MKARAMTIHTPHGDIETPTFTVVGTKGTVKALTVEQVREYVGAQVVLANTYHLYLEPGHEHIERAGGIGAYMGWSGPTFTDSGGFQVFSLGAAYGTGATKLSAVHQTSVHEKLAHIDEEGVTFTSVIDGSTHRFTPERAIEIQQAIGADVIFMFDECTSPIAPYEYQRRAMERTHRWAERCLLAHTTDQMLYGVIQGGRYEDLRRESARVVGSMDVAGFGIGGSFDKEDIATAVGWVIEELEKGKGKDKPRHLLGIGEPEDIWAGVEQGIDTFDCVAPTRIARNGTLYTSRGKINITNARFHHSLLPVDETCQCYTCTHYTAGYVSHLFRAREMLAATLASIHNLYFIVTMMKRMRQSIFEGTFEKEKRDFFQTYKKRLAD